ncbi:glycosyltransferase [Kiritimatiellota bacterium B12222]|nr:glycosyltransferase [Kiritimatiellota bacterium B12222]
MKPRVLFLSPQPFFQWRGSPIRVQHNLRALSQLGYDVDLLTLPFGEDVDIENVRIHRVKGIPGVDNVPIGPSFWKIIFDIKLYFKARNLCKHHNYAVIHGIEEAGCLGYFLSRKQQASLVYEKHSDPASYRKNFIRNMIMAAYAQVENFTVQRADAVIATGQGLADAVLRMKPDCHCTHLFDIPSSLAEADQTRIQNCRTELLHEANELLATYVGSFAVYQGIDLLFDSIPLALQKAPQLRFVIIGGSDAEIAERKHALQQAGVADKVSFLGKVDPESLPDYLGASDLLLSPRISGNNTPLKLLDYLKAGRAIVATDLEANRLIINETMATFSALTPAAFAQAIVDLALDTEARTHKATQGRALIDDVYNFTHYTQKLGEVYHALPSLTPLSPPTPHD